jgi:allantoinase
MTALASHPTTLLFHAEMIPPITTSVGDDVQISLPPLEATGPLDAYSTFLASRPPAFETYAIEEVLSLAHLAPSLQLHIVHLSAVECIPLLRAARQAGVKISAETCFHYLALAAEDVETGDTRHKCCPPIRGSRNRDGLWAELSHADSVIETIVSDHSPCTPELKLLPARMAGVGGAADPADPAEDERARGDFFASWGGISSVGLGLSILWTAISERASSSHNHDHDHDHGHTQDPDSSCAARPALTILDIVRLCAVATSKQVGLSHRKGMLKVGMDADVCVFDDGAEFLVGREQMLFRNKVSPYQGRTMRGMVRATYLRGRGIWSREDGFGEEMAGKNAGPRGVLLLERRTV